MSERSLPEKPATDAPASRPKSKGASKGKRAPRPQRVRGKLLVKAKAAKLTRSQPAAPERQADQGLLKRIAPSGEGYVRLRIRVGEDGGTSIVDSHFVDSTLIQPTAIHGNFAFEITEGEKRHHLDSIPDLGVFRSFVNPEGPLEERQHHVYELKSYDFDVRVPARELTAASLPKVAIVLYRVKEARPAMPIGIQPLHVQYQWELREIARLDGVPARILPEALRKLGGKSKSARRK
jgi:hypothetical protein